MHCQARPNSNRASVVRTLASRIDGEGGAVGTSSFTYDWARRLATATLPSAWGATAPATYTYRADGLAAARTWNGESDADALTFAYDPAKRPTGATKGSFLSLGQAYDRRGNVTQESRTLAGVSGIAGSGSQSFSYDALSRLTGLGMIMSTGPTVIIRTGPTSDRFLDRQSGR